jgi:hypothetical protein
MTTRALLLSTTVLCPIVGLLLGTSSARARDVVARTPEFTLPAVDGINGKLEALGGSYAKKSLYGVGGSLSVPLQGQFGAQVDGALGSFDSHTLGVVAGHLFWREPQKGLLGLYGDTTHWNQFGGVHVSRFGGEGEAYWGRWTLYGLAGVETGNNSLATTGSSVTVPSNGAFLTTVTSSTDLANVTRFFDRINLSYYITDDWKAFVGHRYLGGKHLLALGSEYALPAGHGTMASLFAEGRLGEGANNYGVWGGVRFYFGQHDKSLIRRHREDDPQLDWTPESLFSLANSLGPGSSTTHSCSAGEIYQFGICVLPSDIRLKCDIALLARLDNGIGLYRYRYLWSDIEYVGVMAQEVAEIVPEAAILGGDGYYRVDYARLGLRLMTRDEWTARHIDPIPLAA